MNKTDYKISKNILKIIIVCFFSKLFVGVTTMKAQQTHFEIDYLGYGYYDPNSFLGLDSFYSRFCKRIESEDSTVRTYVVPDSLNIGKLLETIDFDEFSENIGWCPYAVLNEYRGDTLICSYGIVPKFLYDFKKKRIGQMTRVLWNELRAYFDPETNRLFSEKYFIGN